MKEEGVHMKLGMRFLIIMLGIISAATIAQAREHVILIRSSDIILNSQGENAYVFQLDIASSIKNLRLDYATIEYFVDEIAGDTNEPYVLKFAPLENYSKGDTTYTVKAGNWPCHEELSRNSSKRIVMDITPVIETLFEQQGTCYAVLFKSDGEESIHPALKSDVLGSNVLAKIKVHVSNR
jgi:hypothetical protein